MSKDLTFKIDHNYQYQIDAVRAITDIFEGQKGKDSLFTITSSKTQMRQMRITEDEYGSLTDPGVANDLELLQDKLLENVQMIQLRNGLPKSEDLHGLNFSIEMETGTGKTYVYLRSIFELNKLYGFKKFIIVVPSIAIKEGVNKSIEIMGEPLRTIYDNANFNSFVYDSSDLEKVRSYATSTMIEIMIINIQAFRKSFENPEEMTKANIFHREIDTLNGRKPQELIAQTRPIVIIDEPQSVDRTAKSKEAIASLNALCTLRYSATHLEHYNLMHKLDPVDAYEQKLVKKIVVDSIHSEGNFNKPYIRLVNVNDINGYSAFLEIDVQNKKGKVQRKTVNVKTNNDLFELTGEREQYQNGYVVTNIECYPGKEYIKFSNGEKVLMGATIGDIDDEVIKRAQIRKTIESHLDVERELFKSGIKVLSLFFLDRVGNYRWYDGDGNPQPGKYLEMFELEYKKAIRNRQTNIDDYSDACRKYVYETDVSEIHDGYFACDKKKDTKGNAIFKESKGEGNAVADESAYDLIMRDKERLLNFNTPLRFIFSHSALKEGWDNPNVFQICTLIETKDTFTKRQKIGRGLRLAVYQNGERSTGHEINILTVVANESYEEFAAKLQKELTDETGVKFGVIEKHSFASIMVKDDSGLSEPIGYETSEQIWGYLKEKDYIYETGKVQDKLKEAIRDDTFELPPEYGDLKNSIIGVIKKSTRKLEISNKENEVEVKLNKRVYLDPMFDDLWNKIKYKTVYSVSVDIDKLVADSVDHIKFMNGIPKLKIISKKTVVDIKRSGVHGKGGIGTFFEHGAMDFMLPDILRYVQEHTGLKRKTIATILDGAGRYEDFMNNPQRFMEEVINIINLHKKQLLVDGIKYERIGSQEYYKQELFEVEELKGYLNSNVINSEKSPYTQVYYDSNIEREFAEHMEDDPEVKIYAKLPRKFIIDTPFGGYNPDWAVLMNKNGEERLYFVIETKGSLFSEQYRLFEDEKINCGRKHFAALNTGVDYRVATNLEDFKRGL